MGTESSVDRSKSIKSHLMQLFTSSGNYDIEVRDALTITSATTVHVLVCPASKLPLCLADQVHVCTC